MWKTDLMVGGDLLLNHRVTPFGTFVFHTLTDAKGFGGSDIFLAKIDDAGKIVWATYLGTSSNETVRSLAVDSQGNIFVSYSQNTGSSSTSVSYLFKMDQTGKILWTRSYNATGATNFVLGNIETDGTRVYAQGYLQTSSFTATILALDAVTGDIVWNVVGPTATSVGVELATATSVRFQFTNGTVATLTRDTGALVGVAYQFSQSGGGHEPKATHSFNNGFLTIAVQTAGTTAQRGVYIHYTLSNGNAVSLGAYGIGTSAVHTYKWSFVIGNTLYIGFTEGNGHYSLANCTIISVSLTNFALIWSRRTDGYLFEAGRALGNTMTFMVRDRSGNVSTVQYTDEAELLADPTIVATTVAVKSNAMIRGTVGFGINSRAYTAGNPQNIGNKAHDLNPKPAVLKRLAGWMAGG